jgi:hypothetical protein
MTDQRRKNTRNPLCNLADKHAVELEKRLIAKIPQLRRLLAVKSENRIWKTRRCWPVVVAQMVRSWQGKG